MGMDGAVRLPKREANTATVTADALEAARMGFHRARPRRSARRVFHFTQLMVIAALFYAAYTLGLRYRPPVHWMSLMTALCAAALAAAKESAGAARVI